MSEINSLRESSRMELRRTERMEQTYAQVEDRLKALKVDIAKTEASYEKVTAFSSFAIFELVSL